MTELLFEADRRVRVYIAGPMSGIPDFNYPAFNDAAQRLRDKTYAVLNPVENDRQVPEGASSHYAWFLRVALKMMLSADGVALLPGWEASGGARLEVMVAEKIGLDIRSVQGWLEDSYDETLIEPPC